MNIKSYYKKTIKIFFITLILFTFLSSSTGTKIPTNSLELVPEDATFIISSPSISTFIKNANFYLEKINKEQADASTQELDILQSMVNQNGIFNAITKSTNSDGRVIAAFYNYSINSDDTISCVLIFPKPQNTGVRIKEIESNFKKLFPNKTIYATSYNKQNITVSIDFGEVSAKTPKLNSLQSFSAYNKSSVVMWFNTKTYKDFLAKLPKTDNIYESISQALYAQETLSFDNVEYETDYDFSNKETEEETELETVQSPEADDAEEYQKDYDFSEPENNLETPLEEDTITSESEYSDEDQEKQDYLDNEYSEEIPEEVFIEEAPGMLDCLEGSLLEVIEKFSTDAESVEFSITIHSNNIWKKVSINTANSAKLQKLSKFLSKGNRSIPYLSFCDEYDLLSAAWSITPNSFASIFKNFIKSENQDDFFENLLNSDYSQNNGAGENGSFSFDFAVSSAIVKKLNDNDFLKNLDPNAIEQILLSLIPKSCSTQEIKNRQAYKAFIEKAMEENKCLFDILKKEEGIDYTFEHKNKMYKNMPCDQFVFTFSSDIEENQSFVSILNKFATTSYLYTGDKVFYGFGTPERVIKDISTFGAKNPLNKNKQFQILKAGASRNTRAIVYLSTKSFIKSLWALESSNSLQNFSINNTSGILFWLDSSKDSIGFGIGTNIEDVKALGCFDE